MFLGEEESIGESIMVTNAEIAKKVDEKEEENRLLKARLAQLEQKVDDKTEEVKDKIEEKNKEDKNKEVLIEDEVSKPDPLLIEEPFLKALKALSGKALEGIPIFSGKMEPGVVLDWIEGLENHFECEKINESQKVKVSKAKLRGYALTWWKFIQDERENEGKKPIATWKAMVAKIRDAYVPKDYER